MEGHSIPPVPPITRERDMKALAGAALGALFASTLGAPPAAALAGLGALEGGISPAVLQVADRRCTQKGGRHCPQGRPRRKTEPRQREQGYGYSYGTPRAEFYATGSSSWWQAMEREGRTGLSPD
jgi:hypothetical protein